MSQRPRLRLVHRTDPAPLSRPAARQPASRAAVNRQVMLDLLAEHPGHLDPRAVLHRSQACPTSTRPLRSTAAPGLLEASWCSTCAPGLARVSQHRTAAQVALEDMLSVPPLDDDLRPAHVAALERVDLALDARDDSDPRAAATYSAAAQARQDYELEHPQAAPSMLLVHPRFDLHRAPLMRDLHLSPQVASHWCRAHHRVTLLRLTTAEVAAQVGAAAATSSVECGNQALSIALPPGWTPTHSTVLTAAFTPHRPLPEVLAAVMATLA